MTGPLARGGTAPTAPRRSRQKKVGGRRERPPDPDAGCYLLAGIDAVLPLLTAATSTAPRQLAEDLRTALARTAACGNTCRVAAAADTVRAAADLLLAGSTDEAREALRRARAVLVDSDAPC